MRTTPVDAREFGIYPIKLSDAEMFYRDEATGRNMLPVLIRRMLKSLGFVTLVTNQPYGELTLEEYAERALRQLPAFLSLRRENAVEAFRRNIEEINGEGFSFQLSSSGGLSPSPLLDEAWHVLILDTDYYPRFCEVVAGTFIRHNPCDEEILDGPERIEWTRSGLRWANHEIDPFIWMGSGDRCSYKCCNSDC